jgi:RNA polymerase sigma-70 factor (ECF subfamily)
MSAHKTLAISNYSDEDLMELFQAGKESAFNELAARYTNRLHNFLYRYTHNHLDCEDLVQETFLRVHKSKHSYERIAKFSTWMYTIAINLAKSLYKKKSRMSLISIHKDDSNPDDFEFVIEDSCILQDEELHQKLSMQQLEAALNALKDEFKEVVTLRDLQQLTYEEISEKLDVPMGTVKSRINRGRAQIAQNIQSYVDMGTSF